MGLHVKPSFPKERREERKEGERKAIQTYPNTDLKY